MAQTVTRKVVGLDDDGQPVRYTTVEAGRMPRDAAGFLTVMASHLGVARHSGPGKVLADWVQAHLAGVKDADAAAVKAGAALDVWRRLAAVRILRQWQAEAGHYCPAARPAIDRLLDAWVAKYGDKHPEPDGFVSGGSSREIAEQRAAFAQLPPRVA